MNREAWQAGCQSPTWQKQVSMHPWRIFIKLFVWWFIMQAIVPFQMLSLVFTFKKLTTQFLQVSHKILKKKRQNTWHVVACFRERNLKFPFFFSFIFSFLFFPYNQPLNLVVLLFSVYHLPDHTYSLLTWLTFQCSCPRPQLLVVSFLPRGSERCVPLLVSMVTNEAIWGQFPYNL